MKTVSHPVVPTANLGNCDQEPIHIPGSIQPHGALLAFAPDGTLAVRSKNAGPLLGEIPAIGQPLDARHLNAALRQEIGSALACFEDVLGAMTETLGQKLVDVIMHQSDGLLVVEFEFRPDHQAGLESFALQAQKAIVFIQRQRDIHQVLTVATEKIAALTGFDRVMAYRFRHDESGEVVAERRHADLVPYLGQRYPASDIPQQARRLYVLNPVRLIVDAAYEPVLLEPLAVESAAGLRPLDLSQSTLRSVSPIHIEYLQNMGVAASMSISIVVDGKLWGLFACHHMSPFLVPYAVRMACQVLAQSVSMIVDRHLASDRTESLTRAASARSAINSAFEDHDSLLSALVANSSPFFDLIKCDCVAASFEAEAHAHRSCIDRQAIAELVKWLDRNATRDVFYSDNLRRDAPGMVADLFGPISGVLAIRYNREQNGYLFWLRNEQVQNVRWGGPPEKNVTVGPLGQRLTPRGSFEEWKQTVREQSVPWEETDLEIAAALRVDLQDISLSKAHAASKTREMFMATLGHDLRDPLQAIKMASEMLSISDVSNRFSHRITSSSNRMQRLIDQLSDLSTIQHHQSLPMHGRNVELNALLDELVDELKAAHPGADIQACFEPLGVVWLDPDRMGQVVANLVGNACKHGVVGSPVQISAWKAGDQVAFQVRNQAERLSEDVLQRLFDPFKATSLNKGRNPKGQGLGLYISSEIIKAHGGRIEVRSSEGWVEVDAWLPVTRETG
jgi:chemotaxis family two-component system sensor kinase Cph1